MTLKIRIFLLLYFTTIAVTIAQRPAPDVINTSNGPMTIQPVVHGSLVMMWNDKTIYIDPFGGAAAFDGIQSPDLILITDIHGDHLHLETLNNLETTAATIVAPQAVADQLPEKFKAKLVVIGNGEKTSQLGIDILAMPMYNLPETDDSRHPKGRGNGYVLTIGGKKIYISGDTEDIDEMRQLTGIDVAFVCMNMPYTMDINQAASAVLAFKPKIVYPFHYRGSDTEAFKNLVEDGNKQIEVRLRNWYGLP